MTAEMQFCPYCSQKNTNGKIRVRSFLAVFVNQVFNIESKLFKTLRDLFIPGKLTIEYFKGRHQTYFHPLRLFIVLAVIFIAFLTFSENDFIRLNPNEDKISSPSFHKKVYYSILFHQLDSLNSVNYQIKKYDSTTYRYIEQLICDTLEKYENTIRNPFSERNIEVIDLIELDDQEIFSFHAHSFIFLLFTVVFLFSYLLDSIGISNKIIEVIVILTILMVPVYILFALKKVYEQKWWTTVLKFLGISFNYAILSLVFFILIVALGFVFF